jgi:cytochrome P450
MLLTGEWSPQMTGEEDMLVTHQAPCAGPITRGSLLSFPRDPLARMRQLHATHGPVAALEGEGRRLAFVFSPAYVQEVLTDVATYHSQFFAIRGSRNSAQRRVTSNILSQNGEEHKRFRRLVMGPFQKKCFGPYHDVLAKLAGDLVASWQPGETRNMFREMTRYMLRVTSVLLFGCDVDGLAYEIGRDLERWVALNHAVGIGAFAPDPQVGSSYDDLLAAAASLEQKVRALIEHRRGTVAAGDDVLSRLILAHDDSGVGMTDAELIGQTTVLFGAAHLTTANTLTWTLFLLAQHPRVASALVEELDAALGGAAPSLRHLEGLPLLDAVIKESMRILPASAYSHRVNVRPVQIGDLRLPPGTPIIFSQVITHHLPELFPEPEAFRPERWRTISPSPYSYFPFAAGPRMCIGAGLATMILKFTLTVILQHFRFSLVPGATIDARVDWTMLNPASGMPMRLLPREAEFTYTPVNGSVHDLVELGPPLGASRSRAA